MRRLCRTKGGHWWAGVSSTISLGLLFKIYRDLAHLHTARIGSDKCSHIHRRNCLVQTHLIKTSRPSAFLLNHFKWARYLNVAVHFSQCYSCPTIITAEALSSHGDDYCFFRVWLTDNNAIKQGLWGKKFSTGHYSIFYFWDQWSHRCNCGGIRNIFFKLNLW